MTSYLNKKEQVISFELTPYGKHILSKGEFAPEYYCFYDDDILYDGEYAGLTEIQNNIVSRIKETERLSTQTRFTSSVNNTSITNIGHAEFYQLSVANLSFMQPLGSSSPFSAYMPSWHLSTMADSVLFSGSATYATNLAIPTVSASLRVDYSRSTVTKEEEGEQIEFVHYDLTKNDRILIDVLELNTILKSQGNFDIEVFKVEDSGNGNLKKLGFVNQEASDADILNAQEDIDVYKTLSSDEDGIEGRYPKLNNTFAEYYLSVKVDKEIEDVKPRPGENLYKAGKISIPEDVCSPRES